MGRENDQNEKIHFKLPPHFNLIKIAQISLGELLNLIKLWCARNSSAGTVSVSALVLLN